MEHIVGGQGVAEHAEPQKHDGNRRCCTQSMWQQQRWRQHVDSFHIRIESTRSAKTVRRQEGQASTQTEDTHSQLAAQLEKPWLQCEK